MYNWNNFGNIVISRSKVFSGASCCIKKTSGFRNTVNTLSGNRGTPGIPYVGLTTFSLIQFYWGFETA